MDTKGLHEKYNVTRVDGKPINGQTLTIELDKDPQAVDLLKAIAEVVRETRPLWALDLLAERERLLKRGV